MRISPAPRHLMFPRRFSPAGLLRPASGLKERRAYDQMAFLYQHVPTQIMMSAHPQTLYGLADSPIALAAWMISMMT